MLRESTKIYRDARLGAISTSDGFKLTMMLRAIGELYVMVEFEKKMQSIEQKAKKAGGSDE